MPALEVVLALVSQLGCDGVQDHGALRSGGGKLRICGYQTVKTKSLRHALRYGVWGPCRWSEWHLVSVEPEEQAAHMSLRYVDWLNAYLHACVGDDVAQAQLLNLENETRIPNELPLFKAGLAQMFESMINVGVLEGKASRDALSIMIERLKDIRGPFGCLLPITTSNFKHATTHATARQVARFARLDIDHDDRAPKALPLAATAMYPKDKPTIWLTPDPCPDDPTEVALKLGLPHHEGQITYKANFDISAAKQFIPTCLDAGLFAAWQEPPKSHKGTCGLTRHLETGKRIFNELIVKMGDVASQRVRLVRLPVTNSAVVRVGKLHPNYLVDR